MNIYKYIINDVIIIICTNFPISIRGTVTDSNIRPRTARDAQLQSVPTRTYLSSSGRASWRSKLHPLRHPRFTNKKQICHTHMKGAMTSPA